MFAPAAVLVDERPDGTTIVRSPAALGDYPAHLGMHLRRGAGEHPDRAFVAERQGDSWRTLSWGEALADAKAIGQGLLDTGLGPERPLMILSGNSVDHARLMLGALLAGVPLAPVSPAYSLMSSDHAKLRHIFDLVRPGAIFVEDPEPFAKALQSLDGSGVNRLDVDALAGTRPGEGLAAAEASLGPNSVAKYLFTSGSTALPKGVINTHGMLCANQQMIAQCWPFVRDTPPVLVDWLPWNHTFGANHNFNLVLTHGGTLHVDGGKPAPGLIERTVENLREVSPTIYFNVPIGYARLLPYLEADAVLRTNFFSRLQTIFYAAAALPQDVWERLEALSMTELGRRIPMTSAWGSTETAPMSTTVHFEIDRASVIGLPAPGVEIKMLPSGTKTELRVRGPHVTPGYVRQPELTAAAFDEEGFYKIGDAGKFVDPDDPSKGLAFDGRVAEDFKLTSGTWVNVGPTRVAVLTAVPEIQDAVVTGHGRDYVGLLAWTKDGVSPQVVEAVRDGLRAYNETHASSSKRIARALLLTEPPSVDGNEITDKGYINQRATLERRAELVEELYREPPGDHVIVTDPRPRRC